MRKLRDKYLIIRLSQVLFAVGLPTAVVFAGDDSGDFADFSALDLESLLNIEVSTGGSGSSQKISDIPAVVDVMTREQIAQIGVRDLRELLDFLPSTYRTYHNLSPHLYNIVNIRGGTVSRRISLMVDDHSQLDDFDEAYNVYSIPVASIERVEFLRGPAAVLYGSSAMAGVVRIVTKDPDKNSHGGSITVNLDKPLNGIDGTAYSAIVAKDGNLRFRIDTQAAQTVGSRVYIPVDDLGGSGRFGTQATYTSTLATLRYEDWYIRGQHHFLITPVGGFQASISQQNEDSRMQMGGAEIGFKTTHGNLAYSARAAVDFRRKELDFGRFPPAIIPGRATVEENRTILRFDGYLVESEAAVEYLQDKWHIRPGIQSRTHLLKDFNLRFKSDGAFHPLIPIEVVNGFVEDFNLFLQGGYDPLEKLSLLAGVRVNFYKMRVKNFSGFTDRESSPPSIVSPMGRAAIVYRAQDRVTFKGLYGRSFRLPSALELFSTVRTVIEPSPFINPEIQDTYEMVIDLRPTDALSVRVNGFYNRIFDTIAFLPVPNQNISSFQNSNDIAATWGMDMVVSYIPTSWLNLNGSFTYQEGEWTSGLYLREMPRILAKGVAMFSVLKDRNTLTLTPSVLYRGPQLDESGDTVINANLRWQASDQWTIFLTAMNIAGRNVFRPIIVGAATPTFEENSRVVRIGVQAEF